LIRKSVDASSFDGMIPRKANATFLDILDEFPMS